MISIDTLEFTSNVNRDNGFSECTLGVHKSSMALFGYEDEPVCFLIEWDIPAIDTTEHIGIWTDNDKNLIDYDGVFELPAQAIELLTKNGITVSKDFYPEAI